jgi:hypothetical protein
MSIRDASLPEFSAAIRGYDRRQVTDYLQRLREYVAELEDRLHLTEAEAAAERDRLHQLRAVLAQVRAGRIDSDELLDRLEYAAGAGSRPGGATAAALDGQPDTRRGGRTTPPAR